MKRLIIEYVELNSLKTYANNAKIHDAKQIEQIKQSILQFGINDPIAIWKNNEIIEGHGRFIALTELGINKVPVIRLDMLSDEQRRAYMLAHNKITMNTGFDFDKLNDELNNLNIDFSNFGFNTETKSENMIINKEYNVNDFGDEQFEYECPDCGFKFNA